MPFEQLSAAEPPVAAQTDLLRPVSIRDVALSQGGYVAGQVFRPTGDGVPQLDVAILAGNQVLARTITDSEGRFAFQNLRGGVYVISAGNRAEAYRLWAIGSAPPTAGAAIRLIYEPYPVVRGQLSSIMPCYTNERWLLGALAIGGGVGVAVYNADSIHDRPTSP